MAPLAWWAIQIFIFLLGIFTKVYTLSAFAVILLLISLLARYWKLHSLDDVAYRRKLVYRRGFPGEKFEMQIEIENRKLLPVPWLQAEDQCASAVSPENKALVVPTHTPDLCMLMNYFSLRWFERDRRTYELLLRTRGVHRLGPLRLQSGDPFGLFERIDDVENVEYVTVYPEPLPFNALRLPLNDPFGERAARRRLYEDPTMPMGVRDYRSEDEFRRMHWPATARTGQLQVKVYQPISARIMVVCLNVATMLRPWEGTVEKLLEYLVRATAAVVKRGLEDGYRVGLISNGCLAHADQPFRVAPGRSPEQLSQLLSVLAGVTPFVVGPLDKFLLTEVSRLPYGSSLIILTGIIYPALEATLIRLKQYGWRIMLLCFTATAPQDIPGIRVVHIPFYDETALASSEMVNN